MRIRNSPIKHTHYHSPIVNRAGFSGVMIKNQPATGLYNPMPANKQWWMQGDLLKLISGISAYINVGMVTGFGIGETALDRGIVPRIFDKSSPFMWL